MKIVTLSAVMRWDEEEVKKLEKLMKEIEKNGWDIDFEDIVERMYDWYEIDNIGDWFYTIGQKVLEEMCQALKNFLIDEGLDEEYENAYEVLDMWEDGSFDYVELDESMFSIQLPEPLDKFTIKNFYSKICFDVENETLMNLIKDINENCSI